MKKKIRIYGDEVLRKKAEKVTDIDRNTARLIKNMTDTLLKEGGVGLAAPQVGVSRRIFVAADTEKDRIIVAVNPELVELKNREIDSEGCLSFPGIFFSIQRAKKAVIKALDEKGKEFYIEAGGIIARCFQHEIDHLDGHLIIDYASDTEKKFWKEKLDGLRNPEK